MDLIYITNEPRRARDARSAGVNRVMVDLEILGKAERQTGRETRISGHDFDDLARMAEAVDQDALMVRVNPLHDGSEGEIEQVLQHRPRIVMVPMVRSRWELQSLRDLIGGRAVLCLLLETASALGRADELLSVEGLDEVHVGLNDLHRELGLRFMFELLPGGAVEFLSRRAKSHGVRFGFGGVAPVTSEVPIKPEWILAEHVRLGSTAVILSRDFDRVANEDGRRSCERDSVFVKAITELRDTIEYLGRLPHAELEVRSELLRDVVRHIVTPG